MIISNQACAVGTTGLTSKTVAINQCKTGLWSSPCLTIQPLASVTQYLPAYI